MNALRSRLFSAILTTASLLAPHGACGQDVAAGTPQHLPAPPGVRIIPDLAYARGDHPRQKLDLYIPVPVPAKPMPLIAYFHGGDWQTGSKADGRAFAFRMVARGYAVACVGYRLADEAPFPAQLEDGKVALRWLREYAPRYRLDPAHFGAYGVSAGGWLAALLGTTANSHLLDTGEYLNQSSSVQAACIFCGPVDLVRLYDYASEHGTPQAQAVVQLLGGNPHLLQTQAKTANPLTHLGSGGFAPFLIVHGTEDTDVPPEQGRLLQATLAHNHVPARLHLIRGAGHTGPAFAAPEITSMVDRFFDQTLKPGGNIGLGVPTTVTETPAQPN